MNVTLYMKPECHLCEAAQAELNELRSKYPHQLNVVDITIDANLQRLYGERIPVIDIGGREYAAPLGRDVLEHALRSATA